LGIAGGELSEGRNNIEVGRQAYVYRARRNYFFKGTSSDLINRGVADADALLLIGGRSRRRKGIVLGLLGQRQVTIGFGQPLQPGLFLIGCRRLEFSTFKNKHPLRRYEKALVLSVEGSEEKP